MQGLALAINLVVAVVAARDARADTAAKRGPAGPHAPAVSLAEPAGQPSGLDLLYGDRVAFTPSGEPIVTVGVVVGESHVSFRARSPLQVDFWEAGVEKRASVRALERVELTVKRATPAARHYYLDLEGVRFGDSQGLTQALSGWRVRGYAGVAAVEEGMIMGMRGRVLDNRDYRIVLDVKSREEASRLASEVYRRFGTQAETRARLSERPWGEINVRAGGTPLGTATSYVRLSATDGVVQVDHVEFAPGYAWHGYEDRSYRGELYAVIDPDGALDVVNVLGVETLLEGIVPAELYASSPAEALKAQAVAARNHVLSQLGRRHHDAPFHICAEQHCQVYAGIAKEDPRSSAAVRATSGQALFLDGRLVECAYSASCGGHTEDNDAVWAQDPDPALRGRPDFDLGTHPELAPFAGPLTESLMPRWIATMPASYCAKGAGARAERLRWARHFSAPELQHLVAADYPHLGVLRDIAVEERGPGGRAVSLRLVGTRSSVIVLRELSIRRLFGNLNSAAFVIETTRDAAGALTGVTFKGAGWGHGVGLCQLGAVGRAESGQSYEQILSHYYNGARVERLY